MVTMSLNETYIYPGNIGIQRNISFSLEERCPSQFSNTVLQNSMLQASKGKAFKRSKNIVTTIYW